MSDTRRPRIDVARAKRGPTAEDLEAMPATVAADWTDGTAILPVDRDIFEEAAAMQRVRAAEAAVKPGNRKKAMKRKRAKKPVAETFESLMEDLGIHDEVYKAATKRVLAWQLDALANARR